MNSVFKIKNPNFKVVFKNMSKLVRGGIGWQPLIQRPAFTTPAIEYKKFPMVRVVN